MDEGGPSQLNLPKHPEDHHDDGDGGLKSSIQWPIDYNIIQGEQERKGLPYWTKASFKSNM